MATNVVLPEPAGAEMRVNGWLMMARWRLERSVGLARISSPIVGACNLVCGIQVWRLCRFVKRHLHFCGGPYCGLPSLQDPGVLGCFRKVRHSCSIYGPFQFNRLTVAFKVHSTFRDEQHNRGLVNRRSSVRDHRVFASFLKPVFHRLC